MHYFSELRASCNDNASQEETEPLLDNNIPFFAKQTKLCSATSGKYI